MAMSFSEPSRSGIPAAMQGIAFNTRREQFADRNVRKALRMLFDFKWVNDNLYYGLYTRTAGYWDNSDLSSIGRPASEREQELLAPFPDAVDPDVMAGTWRPADADGSGQDRKVLREALNVFASAGYGLKDRKLVHKETGKPLVFEILAKNEDEEKLALAYIKTLELLGIEAKRAQRRPVPVRGPPHPARFRHGVQHLVRVAVSRGGTVRALVFQGC